MSKKLNCKAFLNNEFLVFEKNKYILNSYLGVVLIMSAKHKEMLVFMGSIEQKYVYSIKRLYMKKWQEQSFSILWYL